ncbi:MAG TPA: response regulator transcription factor [Gammaproteobacteria bacterium]|nr:response regulator transcription factor [Gammaproteobacteria bacterium]
MEGSTTSELEQARLHHARRAWAHAFDAFRTADRASALGADDLERFATAAYLVGRDDDYLGALERAHHAHVDTGRRLQGVRCAFWLGLRLLFRGEGGRAGGWFARAERIIEEEASACAERGYLLLPSVEHAIRGGELDKAASIAAAIVEIAEAFADAELLSCSQLDQGRILLLQGDVARGLARLDELMLAVTANSLSPIVTGLMYCAVIGACQEVCAANRAREWTFALSEWCGQQPEMVSFTAACLVHRAEVLRLHGEWNEALAEAERAARRDPQRDARSTAAAFYEIAETHRLRGNYREAEDAYRDASRYGREPQPGLALLRLAQGRARIAAAAIRRIAGATQQRLERAKVLPAYVEIMIAVDDLTAAHAAVDELEHTAAQFQTELIAASAADARGAIELADDDAYAALGSLRRALDLWQELRAPHPAARAHVAIALACRALGDEDGAALELESARATFERLEARPDLAHVDALRARPRATLSEARALTPRELEVLRLVATGRTNRQIGVELTLSEKTVDRHMSNIFAKLDVPSRAAATAYAFRHRLI